MHLFALVEFGGYGQGIEGCEGFEGFEEFEELEGFEGMRVLDLGYRAVVGVQVFSFRCGVVGFGDLRV